MGRWGDRDKIARQVKSGLGAGTGDRGKAFVDTGPIDVAQIKRDVGTCGTCGARNGSCDDVAWPQFPAGILVKQEAAPIRIAQIATLTTYCL
jgi:hypothetical protein